MLTHIQAHIQTFCFIKWLTWWLIESFTWTQSGSCDYCYDSMLIYSICYHSSIVLSQPSFLIIEYFLPVAHRYRNTQDKVGEGGGVYFFQEWIFNNCLLYGNTEVYCFNKVVTTECFLPAAHRLGTLGMMGEGGGGDTSTSFAEEWIFK